MNKVPVFDIIGEAYRFAFGRFFGNLGVVWLPVLLILVANWYLLPFLIGAQAHGTALAQVDPAEKLRSTLQIVRFALLIWIVALLLRAQMMLGLTQRALGRPAGPGFVYLSLGKPYWRVVGSYAAVAVILIILEIAFILVAAVIGAVVGFGVGAVASKHVAAVTIGALAATLGLVVFALMLYAVIRLTFFLTVMIVDRERFDLTGPWRLARGNVWRIFLIGLAIFVPIGLVAIAGYLALEADAFRILFVHMSPPGSHDPQAAARNMQDFIKALHASWLARWYVFMPLALAYSTLLYGLATGASVSAYRTLATQGEPAA